MPSSPIVLVFHSARSYQTNWSAPDGIYWYARDKGWSVQTVEYDVVVQKQPSEGTWDNMFDARAVFEFWKPNGCIVECAGLAPNQALSDIRGVPTVYLDCYPSLLKAKSICISSDEDSISGCAARELLALGLPVYAYVPEPSGKVWSRERGGAFARYVHINGKRLVVFKSRSKDKMTLAYRGELAKWLVKLPRPVGIFAANDVIASQVLSCCKALGIDVPGEFAVIGADDDVRLCENAHPSLTSVRVDYEGAGRMAAQLLDECMRNAGRQKPLCRKFSALGVVRRASTRRIANADRRILCALEFIRLNACTGAEPPDVVKAMGCSRRMADILFRKVMGHTILDEIHSVRLDRVKALLKQGNMAFSALPDFCGYSSLDVLRRVFKARTGMSLKAFVNA